MLKEVLGLIKPATPTMNLVFAATGLFMGRNFFRVAGCKVIGIAARTFGHNAAEWDEASDKYLKRLQKNIFRDLTVAWSCFVLVFISHSAEQDCHCGEKEPQNHDSGLINDYIIPLLKIYAINWMFSNAGTGSNAPVNHSKPLETEV